MDERLYAELLRHAGRVLGCSEDAADVVHEAVLRVLQRYGATAVEERALLHRAVHNVALDWRKLRGRERERRIGRAAEIADDLDPAVVAETRMLAEYALVLLGDHAGTALAVALGYSLREVARVRERARAQARTSYWRACQRVREVLR
ncbi:MAG: sigma factor [Thermomicrobium sp.]|nr:hypothetical protein [Thermomicrobium sp.]MDW8005837.1 sigma factor [Thermomicrobium sp.]